MWRSHIISIMPVYLIYVHIHSLSYHYVMYVRMTMKKISQKLTNNQHASLSLLLSLSLSLSLSGYIHIYIYINKYPSESEYIDMNLRRITKHHTVHIICRGLCPGLWDMGLCIFLKHVYSLVF